MPRRGKRLFDRFLEQRAADRGEAFIAFDSDADYRRYVDGKPRYDGVAAFLASRGIALPFGAPVDGPADTAHLHCPLGVSVHDLEGDIFANAGVFDRRPLQFASRSSRSGGLGY